MATNDASTSIPTRDLDLRTIDALNQKLCHIEAAIEMIYGVGFESFDSMNSALKDNYLWMLAVQIRETKAMFRQAVDVNT